MSIYWAIGGIFLASLPNPLLQISNIYLELIWVQKIQSKLLDLSKPRPSSSSLHLLLGPFLRKLSFGKLFLVHLYQRFNFFISGLISSLIFAFAHGEPEHLLLYSAMGFTFAFLYVKTKRILVPIFAHVSMNTIVVILQLNQDWIQKL